MAEQQPDTTVTDIRSFALVRSIRELHEQRKDLVTLEIPQQGSIVLPRGPYFPNRRARIVILGEVLEYATINAIAGTQSLHMRTLPIGSIVFPQALDEQSQRSDSLCLYRAGANTKLISISPQALEILEFPKELISYIAQTEERTIRGFIEQINALEFELGLASQDRERAIMDSLAVRAELTSLQQNMHRLEALCLRQQAQIERHQQQDEEDRITERQNPQLQQIPDSDDSPEITVSSVDASDGAILDESDIIDDNEPYSGDREPFGDIDSNDPIYNAPTLRPPQAQTEEQSSDDTEPEPDEGGRRRETLRGIPVASAIGTIEGGPPRLMTIPGFPVLPPPPAKTNSDSEQPEDGMRQTITGVAPPHEPTEPEPQRTRPPSPPRRAIVRVPPINGKR